MVLYHTKEATRPALLGLSCLSLGVTQAGTAEDVMPLQQWLFLHKCIVGSLAQYELPEETIFVLLILIIRKSIVTTFPSIASVLTGAEGKSLLYINA
jgi:hypothetical protein